MKQIKSTSSFIHLLPKAELHLHIEGSFEPDLMFTIAKRNNINIPFQSIKELKSAYDFNNLQEFLDIYYAGAKVLIHEQDFYDLTWAYLQKVHQQNVKHVEIFFDPQTHTERGVAFETVIQGIYKALKDAELNLGISFKLIMSYLRHLSEESAFETFQQSLAFSSIIDGVGLDSSELGNPPKKFKNVFKASAEQGYKLCAHAGEEGPAAYIWEAINTLNIHRIDHGNSCINDSQLMDYLAAHQIPLTLCPLSNLCLKVISDLKLYPLRALMKSNILITLNSDDPAYFGGYINENFIAISQALNLNYNEIAQLAKNSFKASWLSDTQKNKWITEIDHLLAASKL